MSTMECDIAILKQAVHDMKIQYEAHCKQEDEDKEKLMELLLEVKANQDKMKGFWAGAVMVVTALASTIGVLINKILFDTIKGG